MAPSKDTSLDFMTRLSSHVFYHDPKTTHLPNHPSLILFAGWMGALVFATGLGGTLLGGLLFGKSFLGYIIDAVFKLTDEGWRRLTIRWGVFFFFLAVLNEVVWRMVSTDTWVSFKVFGFVPVTFVFALAQMPLINRYAPTPEKSPETP